VGLNDGPLYFFYRRALDGHITYQVVVLPTGSTHNGVVFSLKFSFNHPAFFSGITH
jgi:hypothetical protein